MERARLKLYVRRSRFEALWQVLTRSEDAETYNIGGHNEWANLHIVHLICDLIDELAPRATANRAQARDVRQTSPQPRPRATRLTATKIKNELGWVPAHTFANPASAKPCNGYLNHQQRGSPRSKRRPEMFASLCWNNGFLFRATQAG